MHMKERLGEEGKGRVYSLTLVEHPGIGAKATV